MKVTGKFLMAHPPQDIKASYWKAKLYETMSSGRKEEGNLTGKNHPP